MAGVSAEARTADPIFSTIEKAYAARVAYKKERDRIDALYDNLPAEIRDWPGVLYGGGYGFAQTEGSVARFTAGLKAGLLKRHGETSRRAQAEIRQINTAERETLAKIREHDQRELAAYRDAGLPFKPHAAEGGEDEYMAAFLEPMWDGERTVAECAPTTAAGFIAKAHFLTATPGVFSYNETAEEIVAARGSLSPEHFLFRLGEDAARLAGDVA